MDMFELLHIWLNSRKIQQQSEHTLSAYERDVRDFLNFCQRKKLDLNNIASADLREYLAEKVERQQLATSSLQRALSAIRQFMQWVEQQQKIAQNPAKDFRLKRQPRALPGMLDIETILQILEQPAPEKPLEQQLWLRDKAMLELLYSSGLRLAELQSLNLQDLDFERQQVRVTGKGDKTRIVPFGQKAKQSLHRWLQMAAIWMGQTLQPSSAIFISQRGTRLTPRQIENRVKAQALRAGVSVDLHPHLLRHCFASHLLSASGDLRSIQEMLGHSNLNTTQIYTHIDFDHLAKIYDQAHPRAQK
ncbi:tyrosine recombinase XerC [Acinetobacter sp. ANC 4641]|uniref:tyrosine recombinase XerC n=1 Tax=Acinetobacter sp. ANC 4641 TaxID=2529847 RepID=UPI00103EDDB7|nr:tyrosine recombinase XerC [Acinetobacter sp. ANC 4641]TCB11401.1 tyrosine recombinase XerC [Acinetobacter sp. ANC 4641]